MKSGNRTKAAPRRGRAADRGDRYDARPGDAVRLGQGAGLASWTPGVLVSRDGDGHTGFHQGNPCVDNAVEKYLLAGNVPQDGLSC